MKANFFKSMRLTIATVAVFSGLYTLAILGAAKFLGPAGGKVQLYDPSGTNTGAVLLGQAFSKPEYFWGRPSAVNYDASGSAGSNKGPTNPEYLELVSQRIDTFLAYNPGVERKSVPSELVTASGSGLDPDISPTSALIQVPRISAVRGIPEEAIRGLIIKLTEPPLLGLFGTEQVNVTKLNIELDGLQK
ncbi:MAG: potassium-transporting ATPase subunit C [Ignavibacteria bacterium]|nr:potassium-transporting ATPase subunit C [Ignavibacteria bacterium]